jgi:hypothetical protein
VLSLGTCERLEPYPIGISRLSDNSDSVEVQGKVVSLLRKTSIWHWFRSALVWSPDSSYIAVVDLRQKQQLLYLVVVGLAGSTFEHKLDWQDNATDWPPSLDFQCAGRENKLCSNTAGRHRRSQTLHGVPSIMAQ